MKFLRLLSLWILLLPVEKASARAPEEAEFQGAGILGERIADWIADLEHRPTSVGIFSVRSNPPLEQDYSGIVETEILKNLTTKDFLHVMSCTECRTPQVSIQDENLVISKGAPDLETLKRIGQKQPVEAFLTVDIYRTKLSILAQAVLYENPTGKVLSVQRFTVPSLNFSDAAVQVLVTVGAGKALKTGATDTSLSTAGNISLLEELGFGKGGLNLGAVLGGSAGTLVYINPTFAFRGRFGSTALAWSLALGLGYGFGANAKGLTPRIAYDLYLGSLTVVGLEGLYFIPSASGSQAMNGYVGFHMGFALGR